MVTNNKYYVKKFGEVFTPFKLVNEMLDTLPEEVWSNPNFKWADLCNGMGNFMIIVVKRLMNGLRQWEKNEAKRYKHIIEKMIYVGELQAKNMFLWMLSIDPKSKLKLNIYTGDTLKPEFDKFMKEEWKVEKFDIIVGNPPFHEQVSETKTQQLYGRFVIKYFNLLKNDGFLNIVHPGAWKFITDKSMSELKEINKIYTSNNLIAKFFSYKKGKEVFDANTDYDLICLKKEKSNGDSIIYTEKDGKIKINIKGWKIIPSNNLKLYQKLLAKGNEEKVNLIYSRSLYGSDKKNTSKEKNNIFKYPCVYGFPIKGLNLIYSSENKGHFNIPKVILIRASIYSLIDLNGDYGMTQYAAAIVDEKDNLDKIKNAVDSEKFKSLKGDFLGIISQNRNASIDATGHMFKVIKTFRKDFWKEFIDENEN